MDYPAEGLKERFPDLAKLPIWPALAYAYWIALEHDHEDGLDTILAACLAQCKKDGLRIVAPEEWT